MLNNFTMQYTIHTSDDGKHFIYDQSNHIIVSYCRNLQLAKQVTQSLNRVTINSTKTH
jgi:hypothetical protein